MKFVWMVQKHGSGRLDYENEHEASVALGAVLRAIVSRIPAWPDWVVSGYERTALTEALLSVCRSAADTTEIDRHLEAYEVDPSKKEAAK